MIFKDQIIGYYYGKISQVCEFCQVSLFKGFDPSKCSHESMIKIRPDFRGKDLCKELARFTYCSLSEHGVNCIKLHIVTKNTF